MKVKLDFHSFYTDFDIKQITTTALQLNFHNYIPFECGRVVIGQSLL